MSFTSATELAGALRRREVSAREAAGDAIGRIEAHDATLKAVVVRDFDRALKAADAADEALGQGDERPLLGVPMTVKEAFDVAGLATTWGLAEAARTPMDADAAVVERLKRAGAVILGKTNIATMLGDWQTANPLYGVTRNPWDFSRTPGGSSGGAAAALAAGLVPLEYGSDLAASLRAPAAFCGVYAHKPSFGLVPTRGFAPPGAPRLKVQPMLDMAVLGPMARTAADLRLALDATAGPDGRSAVGYRLALPPPRHASLKDYRVLVLTEHPRVKTAAAVRDALSERARALAAIGCHVAYSSHALPDLAAITDTFVQLLSAMFPAEGQAGPSHAEWLRADSRRAELAQQWDALFGAFDVVLCPAVSTTAPPLNPPAGPPATLDVDGETMPYEAQPLWAALATPTGQPATGVPIGQDRRGLPIGGQLIGPFMEDLTPIAVAELMEQAFGGFIAPPSR
jgi:amidase